MTQKSCFLTVAEPGFGTGSGPISWIWSRLTAVNRDHFKATETASIFIAMRYNDMQGLSQELETGCLKLAIVKFLGVRIFKGVHNILRFQP